jgi:Zn-dependent protease with chaperone function
VTSALSLLAFGITAGTLGAGWLRDSQWPRCAPRLAIAAWQALALSTLLSLCAAGLTLAISLPHVGTDLAELLDLCAQNLRHGYASPGGTATAVLGVTLFLILLTRTLWCSVAASVAERRQRDARLAVVDIVGDTRRLPGTVVLDHPSPFAFCIGGRHQRVVITCALLTTLSTDELDAVLAHENAHLRQRHHLALLISRALFATLAPIFPSFRRAMPLAHLYAEMSADDAARARVGALSLRSALAELACMPAPAGSLAASANDVEARMRRLDGRRTSLAPGGLLLVCVGIAVATLVPFALAAGPALAMAWEGICLIG